MVGKGVWWNLRITWAAEDFVDFLFYGISWQGEGMECGFWLERILNSRSYPWILQTSRDPLKE